MPDIITFSLLGLILLAFVGAGVIIAYIFNITRNLSSKFDGIEKKCDEINSSQGRNSFLQDKRFERLERIVSGRTEVAGQAHLSEQAILRQLEFLWENFLQDQELRNLLSAKLNTLKEGLMQIPQMEDKLQQSERNIGELQNALDARLEKIEQLQTDCSARKAEIQRQAEEMESLKSKHLKEIKCLKSEQELEIERLKAEHKQEIKNLEDEYIQKLTRQESDMRREINGLEQNCVQARREKEAALNTLADKYDFVIPKSMQELFGPIENMTEDKLLPLYGFLLVLRAPQQEIVRRFRLFDADLSAWGERVSPETLKEVRERIQLCFNTLFKESEVEIRWPIPGERYDNRIHDSVNQSGNTIAKIKSACIYCHGQIEIKSSVETM